MHSEDGTRPQMGEQEELHQTDHITYSLRVVNKATRGSAGGFAADRPDYIPTGVKQGHKSQQGRFTENSPDQITYILSGWNKTTGESTCQIAVTSGHLQTGQGGIPSFSH